MIKYELDIKGYNFKKLIEFNCGFLSDSHISILQGKIETLLNLKKRQYLSHY